MSTGALVREGAPVGHPEPPHRPRGHWRPWIAVAVPVAVIMVMALGTWQRAGDQVTGQVEAPPAPALETAVLEPDWDLAVRSLVAFDQWLRLYPDPDRVADYMTADHPLYSEALEAQRRLVSGEWRYEPEPATPVVSSTRFLEQRDAEALVEVQFAGVPAYRVVDRDGDEVRQYPARAAITLEWRLRYEGSRWLLAGSRQLAGGEVVR